MGIRWQPSESPFEPQWLGAEIVRIKVNRSVRVRKPSVFLVAMAAASSDDTVGAHTHLAEVEWGRIQRAEHLTFFTVRPSEL